VPDEFTSESLFEKLKYLLKNNDKVLIPRAKNARDFLVENLKKICSVTEIHTYETKIDDSRKDDLIKILTNTKIDYITFASSSSVKNFVEMIGIKNIGLLKNAKIISIGPITSDTIKSFNLNIYKQASEATIDSLIECMK
jgi:uroporphyrinogen III methyltransferase/synthase